jgi:hypothetical protein
MSTTHMSSFSGCAGDPPARVSMAMSSSNRLPREGGRVLEEENRIHDHAS